MSLWVHSMKAKKEKNRYSVGASIFHGKVSKVSKSLNWRVQINTVKNHIQYLNVSIYMLQLAYIQNQNWIGRVLDGRVMSIFSLSLNRIKCHSVKLCADVPPLLNRIWVSNTWDGFRRVSRAHWIHWEIFFFI